MAKQNEGGISWADYTFNPWWGCTKVSEACENCYAEKWAKRCGYNLFGIDKYRREFKEGHWNEVYKWDRKAESDGTKPRVFCGSMCDVFEDNPRISNSRQKLYITIEETPHLTWLLLTKRPENIMKFAPYRWEINWPQNLWTGTTVELQKYDWRLCRLLEVPGKHFASIEPMLGPVDLHLGIGSKGTVAQRTDVGFYPPIDWLICGGESGPNARPMHPDWVRSLLDQCQAASVPFHFKQWGEWGPYVPAHLGEWSVVMPAGQIIDRHDLLGAEVNEQGGSCMYRVGKKTAGHILDGKEWLEFPSDNPI